MAEKGKKEAFDILTRSEVFLGLADSDLEKIAALPSCRVQTYEGGEVISGEGEEAQDLCIVAEGKVRLTMKIPADAPGAPGQITIDTANKGGVFGWSALVAPHILTLSQVCAEPTRVLAINGAELRYFLDQEQGIGYEVMKGLVRIMGARLRGAQQVFVNRKKEGYLGATLPQ
jgi:CRP-like cAMP-binding protein